MAALAAPAVQNDLTLKEFGLDRLDPVEKLVSVFGSVFVVVHPLLSKLLGNCGGLCTERLGQESRDAAGDRKGAPTVAALKLTLDQFFFKVARDISAAIRTGQKL